MPITKTVALIVAMSFCVSHAVRAAPEPCRDTAESSRKLVISFYTKALIEKQPRAAFEQYTSTNFVEHKPDVPNGERAAIAKFLEDVINGLPNARWEILRTVAEKEFVFLHARFTPVPGTPPYAIADLFRVKNCTIVEHWDVVEPPRAGQPNPISKF